MTAPERSVVAKVERIARGRGRVGAVLGGLVGTAGALCAAAALVADGRSAVEPEALALCIGCGAVVAWAQARELRLGRARLVRELDAASDAGGELATAWELESGGSNSAFLGPLIERALARLGPGSLARVCPSPALALAAPLLGAAALMFAAGGRAAAPAGLDAARLARLSAEELAALAEVFESGSVAPEDAGARTRAALALERGARALRELERSAADEAALGERLVQAQRALDQLSEELGSTPPELEAARAGLDSLGTGLGVDSDPHSPSRNAGAETATPGSDPGAAGQTPEEGGAGSVAGAEGAGAGPDRSGSPGPAGSPGSLGGAWLQRGARAAAPRLAPGDEDWIGAWIESRRQR